MRRGRWGAFEFYIGGPCDAVFTINFIYNTYVTFAHTSYPVDKSFGSVREKQHHGQYRSADEASHTGAHTVHGAPPPI